MSASAMPNDNGNLRRVIEELKGLPKKIGEKISSGVGDKVSTIKSQFSRENLVNAMLPRPFATLANRTFDRFGSKDGSSSSKPSDSSGYGLKPNTEEESEVEVDAIEALADHIADGFEETNENLSAILEVLDDGQEETVQLLEVNGGAVSTIEKETKETNLELISVNGTILRELKQINKNTTVDHLANKESDWEARRKAGGVGGLMTAANQPNIKQDDNGSGFGSGFGGVLSALFAQTALGKLSGWGKKGLGKIAGAASGIGKALGGAAASVPTLVGDTPKPTVSTTPNLSVVDDVAKAVPNATGASKVAGAVSTIETEMKETNLELISVNGTILRELKQINKNTTIDHLANKEADWEARRKAGGIGGLMTAANQPNIKQDDNGSGFGGVLSALLAQIALGKLAGWGKAGLGKIAGAAGGLGKSLGGAASGIGKALAGTRFGKWGLAATALGGAAASVPTLVGDTPKPTVSTTPNLSVVDDVAKAVPNAAGASKVAGAAGLKLGATVLSEAKGMLKPIPFIGNAVTAGIGAYDANELMNDETKTELEKKQGVSKIAGGTAGSIVGGTIGGALGMVGGPAGAILGAYLGMTAGEWLGGKAGEVLGEKIYGKTPEQLVKETEPAQLKAFDAVPLESDIQSVEASKAKSYRLQSLTEQIEKTNAEKETLSTEKQIIPVPINNSGSKTAPQTNQAQTKTQIPGVRNNDGTIQRLLDANYAPLMN